MKRILVIGLITMMACVGWAGEKRFLVELDQPSVAQAVKQLIHSKAAADYRQSVLAQQAEIGNVIQSELQGTVIRSFNTVFNGLVVVQGTFQTQGNGNRIYGAVMASNADFDAQSLTGGTVVTNSTCAVERAILNNSSLSRVRPLEIRSWTDLSGVVSW